MTTANTPIGTGNYSQAPRTIEEGLAAFNARNPDATNADQVQPSLPQDEIEGYETDEQLFEGEEAQATEGEPEVQEEEVEAAPEEPDTRAIILPDGSEVSIEEARKGYLRQQDYTRKTQQIAEEYRALVSEKTGWAQQAQSLLQNLDALQEKEPDWGQLARERTPEEYNQIHAWWNSRQKTVENARAEMQRAQQQEFAIQKRRFYDHFLEGRYVPEWKDQAKLKDGLGKVYEYGAALGYSPEVIDKLTDPNLIVVFDKARRYDEINGKKPVVQKALSGKPPVTKAGSKTAASPQAQSVKLYEEQFGKTRKIDDAVALFNAKQAARRPMTRR
jgi:hypothetical protein